MPVAPGTDVFQGQRSTQRGLALRRYVIATGRTVDCDPLESTRRAARERLEASDPIVQGSVIPSLLGE